MKKTSFEKYEKRTNKLKDITSFLDNKKNCYINGSYTIDDNGIVNVNGTLLIINQYNDLPLNFGDVSQSLHIHKSVLKTLKGFPSNVKGDCIFDFVKIQSLENSPQCDTMIFHHCSELKSLTGIRCKRFVCHDLTLQEIGVLPSNLKEIMIYRSNIPDPTADEMRQLIDLKVLIHINPEHEKPWMKVLNQYHFNNDKEFIKNEFNKLYKENYEVNQGNDDLSFG